MISKNRKRTYFYYMPYECSAVEEYLENMAEKGWLLESTKGALFKFKPIDPQKLKFSVDIFNKVSLFDHKDTDVALEYREYCEAAGWKYVCQSNKVQFFYTEQEKESLPIHTDEKEKYNLLFKDSLRNVLLQLLITIVFTMNLCIQIFLNASEFLLTSNMMLGSSLLMFFLVVINIVRTVGFILWVIKSKLRLKNNLSIKCSSYRQVKRRNFFSTGFAIMLVLLSIVALIFDTSYGKGFKFLIITSIVLIIVFSVALQVFIDRNKFSREVNMAISIGSSIGIAIVFTGGILAFALASVFNKDKVENINIPLTLVDFEINSDKQDEAHVDNYKSVLSEQRKYWVDEDELSYFVFESKYPWVMKFYENRLVNRLGDIKNGMEIYHSNLPDEIKIYKDRKGKSFVLVASNKIIDINNSPEGISTDEILNVVYNKLLAS